MLVAQSVRRRHSLLKGIYEDPHPKWQELRIARRTATIMSDLCSLEKH